MMYTIGETTIKTTSFKSLLQTSRLINATYIYTFDSILFYLISSHTTPYLSNTPTKLNTQPYLLSSKLPTLEIYIFIATPPIFKHPLAYPSSLCTLAQICNLLQTHLHLHHPITISSSHHKLPLIPIPIPMPSPASQTQTQIQTLPLTPSPSPQTLPLPPPSPPISPPIYITIYITILVIQNK